MSQIIVPLREVIWRNDNLSLESVLTQTEGRERVGVVDRNLPEAAIAPASRILHAKVVLTGSVIPCLHIGR